MASNVLVQMKVQVWTFEKTLQNSVWGICHEAKTQETVSVMVTVSACPVINMTVGRITGVTGGGVSYEMTCMWLGV